MKKQILIAIKVVLNYVEVTLKICNGLIEAVGKIKFREMVVLSCLIIMEYPHG
jgi:hypothetical protein